MSFEERALYFANFIVTLAYEENYEGMKLYIRDRADTFKIVIESRSVSEVPEQIYSLLRQCEVS